jgi:hypothetical protein
MIGSSLENNKGELSHHRSGGRIFYGVEAQHEICQRLYSFPLAQQLSCDVYDFYGDHLVLIESSNFPSTIFTLRIQHQPILLESAEIQLQLGTDRVGEALAHELLHLQLFILGFPLGEMVQIPLPLAPYAGDLIGMCHWVLNLVQHEINYQNFIALGFDKNHFLVKSNEVIDYQKRFSSEFQNRIPAQVEFPRWCIEYLRHFSTAVHGGGRESLDKAQDALVWGSRLYPHLRVIAVEIRKWFEMGAFKDPSQYPLQVNALLGLMTIPKFTGWARVELSHLKKPIAVRLDPRLFLPFQWGEGDFWETPFGIQWLQNELYDN